MVVDCQRAINGLLGRLPYLPIDQEYFLMYLDS